jgi:hypothetical protein
MNRPTRMDGRDRSLSFVDQPRVLVITRNPKRVHTLLQPRETPVTQIQPQQMCERGCRKVPVRARRAIGRASRAAHPIPPVTERSPTHPKPLADRIQTLTGCDRTPIRIPHPRVVHGSRFAASTDRFGAPKLLRPNPREGPAEVALCRVQTEFRPVRCQLVGRNAYVATHELEYCCTPGRVGETRQTRWSQTPLPARACGFKSHTRHRLSAVSESMRHASLQVAGDGGLRVADVGQRGQ